MSQTCQLAVTVTQAHLPAAAVSSPSLLPILLKFCKSKPLKIENLLLERESCSDLRQLQFTLSGVKILRCLPSGEFNLTNKL